MPWCFRHVLFSSISTCPFCIACCSEFQSTHLNTPQKKAQSLIPSSQKTRRLSGSGPDVLEVAITLSEAVDAVVRLAHGADEAAESVGLGLAGESAVLVDLCDGDLDGTVVLGLDDAVGGAALAGDVTARETKNVSPFTLSACLVVLCVDLVGSLSVARGRALGVP
jgi:hypothetical protein